MRKFALALGCAFAATTMIASAHSQRDRVIVRHEAHESIDTNNDGWISRAEATAAAERIFAEMDIDRDARLTPADHADHEDHEEHVEEADIEGANERRIERVIIRREEGQHASLPEIPEIPELPEPPEPPMFMMLIAHAEEADLNGDGALSLDEFRAQQLRFFDASDANGDGRIRLPRFTAPVPPVPPEAPEPRRRRHY